MHRHSQLGWNYTVRERQDVDTFEEKRSEERSRNFRKEKKITRLERERMLRELGVSNREIREAAKRAGASARSGALTRRAATRKRRRR